MKPRTVIVLLILLALFLFSALNWSTFTHPTALNVLFGQVEAPLGLLMLGLIGLLTLGYLLLLTRAETGALLDNRRASKELEKARKLADEAEASCFVELKKTLLGELERLHDKTDQVLRALDLQTQRESQEPRSKAS
jgi:uncharacterized integral membrane protein